MTEKLFKKAYHVNKEEHFYSIVFDNYEIFYVFVEEKQAYITANTELVTKGSEAGTGAYLLKGQEWSALEEAIEEGSENLYETLIALFEKLPNQPLPEPYYEFLTT